MSAILPRIYEEASPPIDDDFEGSGEWMPLERALLKKMVSCAEQGKIFFPVAEFADSDCMTPEIDGDNATVKLPTGETHTIPVATLMEARACALKGGVPVMMPDEPFQCWQLEEREVEGQKQVGVLVNTPFTHALPAGALDEPEKKGLSTGTMVGIGAALLAGAGLLWWGLSGSSSSSSGSPAFASNPVASLERIRQRAPQGMQMVRKIAQTLNEGLSPEAEAREVRQMLTDAEKLGLLGYIDTAILHYPYEVGFSDEMRQRFVSIGGPLAQVTLEAGAY